MKVVINTCFGGFSLSPRGVQRLAELKDRPCYFFKRDIKAGLDSSLISISVDDAYDELFFSAYDIPNPNEVLPSYENWHEKTAEQRRASAAVYDAHTLETRPEPRHDPDLVRVVEELGGEHRTGASGRFAELKVVDIPDGTDYEISEYDGREHIAEAHRTWG